MRALCCLAILPLFLASAITAAPRASWPCPEPEEIAPCFCWTTTSAGINIDCSNVTNDAELARAFTAEFPFTDLENLLIMRPPSEPPVNITTIDRNTFGLVSFINITISNTNLVTITDGAFNNSYPVLENWIVSLGYLTAFPFDDLRFCPKLRDLRVFDNMITHMSDIHSTSLEYLQVSRNPALHYNDDTFKDAPNIRFLLLDEVLVQYIDPGTFAKLSQLEILDLSNNLIEHLVPSSLSFSSPNIREIKLAFNNIADIDQMSISGLTGSTYLWLQHNQITDIAEKVWRPVFDAVNTTAGADLFVFDDNPIECACNIKWLVASPTYMEIIGHKTTCADGTLITDSILHDFITQHCP